MTYYYSNLKELYYYILKRNFKVKRFFTPKIKKSIRNKFLYMFAKENLYTIELSGAGNCLILIRLKECL